MSSRNTRTVHAVVSPRPQAAPDAADYCSVQARRFADVLEDALREAPPRPHRLRVAGPSPFPDPFIFFTLPRFERPEPAAAVRPTAPPDAPPKRAPSRRTFTADQARALDALNALGAGLSIDFTLDELRRRYRWLAMQLHPDRHPGRSDTDEERLAHQFGEATRHYRRLLALVELRH